MACRGVFFALSDEQSAALLRAKTDQAVLEVIEEVEEAWDEDNLVECDKAWDALHRALTDGRLLWANGSYPLNQVVLGSTSLHEGDTYLVSYVPANAVADVAAALEGVSIEWFRKRYHDVVPRDYAPDYGDQDLEYTWSWFEGVRELYLKAAERKRAVVFTVDQ